MSAEGAGGAGEHRGSGAAAKAMALWVVVVLGLLYGVVNTLLNVVDLFTG